MKTMTSGYKIIKALGKRGMRGFYFSYSQYRELARIEKFEDAKRKIVAWGFTAVEESEDIESLVDNLKLSQSLSKEDKSVLGIMLAEPLFWIILGFAGCGT